MTVKQLISELQTLPQDAEVVLFDYEWQIYRATSSATRAQLVPTGNTTFDEDRDGKSGRACVVIHEMER